MNVSSRGKSCMVLECLIIISFVSTALKLVESTLQITGINAFTLPLLLDLNKAASVALKRFYQNKTLSLKIIQKKKNYPET